MIALAALLLLQAAPGDWVPTGVDPDGIAASFDAASVVRIDGDRRRVRLRIVPPEVRPSGLASLVMSVEVDCRAHVMIVLTREGYGAAGQALGVQQVPPAEQRRERVAPGSSVAETEARVCAAAAR